MDSKDKDYETIDKADKGQWKYFFRQAFVCTGPWVAYFLCGLSFGAPTVFIPQIRNAANSTETVSDEMASWLSSVFGYSALPWVIIIPIVTRHIGRKLPFAIVVVNTVSYFLVFFFSTTTTQILISEIMQGMNHACNMTLSVIIVSEYSAPKYRGLFLTIKSASIFWGIWIANAIGTFYPWKYIAVLGICLSIYPFTVLLWPESPQWLASKGRFSECRKTHRWLRGTDEKSEKELENLIASQMEYMGGKEKKFKDRLAEQFRTKCFYKPVLLSIVMMLQYHLSGKVAVTMYSVEIIKKITKDEYTAYRGMLVLDGVTVSGMYVGCVLSKFLKRRFLLFTTTVIGLCFLFTISFYLYTIKLGILSESNVVTVCLLMGFSVAISCGPMIISTSIYGELIPLRYKSSCTMIAAFTFVTISSTILKISPYLFKHLGMHGAFFFYGATTMVCFLFLYKYLPETKDKTLQEIEDDFNGVKRIDGEKEMVPLKGGAESKDFVLY